jgi:uncharacterized protein YprB with RNaseH-like and TPR domain
MRLKSRLSRLQAQAGGKPAAAAPASAASSTRGRLARLRPQGGHAQQAPAGSALSAEALARALEGQLIAEGVIRIRQSLPLEGKLGRIDLNQLRTTPRCPGPAASDTLRRVYIDTETTALSTGSGTLAFLVGIAVVKEAELELTQFLLTCFSAEAALLSAVSGTLAANDWIISYNGKSYDVPLLITRFRMQGLAHPFGALPHFDLLHPVRRLFGRRWNDCRLLTVEEKLIGFTRRDDLPGAEAPAAWFSYLRTGHSRALMRAVAHNRQDIVSLAVAHSAVAMAIDQPQTFDVDLYALARWVGEVNEDHARELLQSHADRLCDNGRRLLGQLLRRAGCWQQAVPIWEALAARGCPDSIERLAKYHEHISKDLAAARRCCELLPASPACEQRSRRIGRKLHKRSPATESLFG